MINLTHCKKCGKDIWFTKIRSAHTGGEERSIPVDAEPVKVKKPGMYLTDQGVFEKREISEMGYQSHFVTCAYAEVFRIKRYAKTKNEKKMKRILMNDLAGMMTILSKTYTSQALKKEWETPEYQSAILRLNETDRIKLIEHKDKLKSQYAEHQLPLLA